MNESALLDRAKQLAHDVRSETISIADLPPRLKGHIMAILQAAYHSSGPAIPVQQRLAGPAKPHEEWEDVVEEIDDMLESGDFDWASDTLEGIRTTISQNHRVTSGQKTAIRNIADKRR